MGCSYHDFFMSCELVASPLANVNIYTQGRYQVNMLALFSVSGSLRGLVLYHELPHLMVENGRP